MDDERTITYREASGTKDDVSLYRGLEHDGGPYLNPTESDDEAREEIEAATAEFIYVNKELAGVVSFIHHTGTYTAELDFIALYPFFQGKGIAEKVLREKMRMYQECFAGVSLTVHPDNARAIRLYEKFGFVKEPPLLELEYGPRWMMIWRPTRNPLTHPDEVIA